MKYGRIILFLVLLTAHVLCLSSKSLKIVMAEPHFPIMTHTFVVNQFVGMLERGHDVYMYAKPFKKQATEVVLRYGLLERTHNYISREMADADIFLAQFGTHGIHMLELKKKDNLPGKLVTCFRGQDISAYEKKNPGMYCGLFQEGDLFLPVCEYFAQRLIELGADPEKIVVLHSGIDVKKFAFKQHVLSETGPIKIVSTSRLSAKKGIEYAIKAVVELHKKYPNIEYTIIGDGSEKTRLMNLVKQFKASNYISFAGWKEPEQVIEILNQSDIFILPSIIPESGDQEGIPNSLKEAMALGLPVVSTYHSGIPDLITHGVSGLLAPEKDYDALANHLQFLIEHPEQWQTMTRAARLVIEQKFDAEMASEKLEQILFQLIGKEEV